MIELLERSTIHGINHIASIRNKIFKYFWILLFFGGLVGILVNSTFVLMKFMTRPVASNIHLNNEPFIWPDMTFCNPTAPYVLTDKSVYNTWINGLKKASPIAQSLVKTKYFTKYYYERRNFEIAETAVTMATLDPRHLKFNDYHKYFSINGFAQSFFGLNYFKVLRRNYTKLFPRGKKNLFTTQTVMHYDNVPCHTLHVHKLRPKYQNFTKALSVIISSRYVNYQLFNSSSSPRKIWLHITDQNTLPHRKPIILLPGYKTFIQLSQTRKHHNPWKRACRTENYRIKLYDGLLQSPKWFEGGSEDCRNMIIQEYVVKTCHCYFPLLPIYVNESGFPRLCWNASIFSEARIIRNTECIHKFRKLDLGKIYKKRCKKYEPVKCDEIVYSVTMEKDYYSDIKTDPINKRRREYMKTELKDHYRKDKNPDESISKKTNGYAMLVIERENDNVDLYEEYFMYPFSELLSDIGGLMGLWMGMSIVGLFELVQYFYFHFDKIRKRGQHEAIQRQEQEDNLQREL